MSKRAYIFCLVVFIIGFLAGFVSGLFSTGGGLILVPAFIYLLKEEPKRARGSSIFCILPMVLRSIFFYYKENWISTYKPASNPNPDLKWERKGELNIGLDFSVLEGRLGGTVDYYNRTTKDLLYWYTVPVPPNLYNQLFTNVGTIKNSGIEVTINAKPLQTKDIRSNTMLT